MTVYLYLIATGLRAYAYGNSVPETANSAYSGQSHVFTGPAIKVVLYKHTSMHTVHTSTQ